MAPPELFARSPVHAEVLVFVPAYEGSQLFDPTLNVDKGDPACVWGELQRLPFLQTLLQLAAAQSARGPAHAQRRPHRHL